MSEEWSDMIWIGISLIVGAVLLTIIFAFNGIGHDLMNNVYQEEANAKAMQAIRTTMPYDNADLKGSEVLAALMDMADNGVYVYVNMGTAGWKASGPIGTTFEDANTVKGYAAPSVASTIGNITAAGNYFTPATEIATLQETFDSWAGTGKTMAGLDFHSTLVYQNDTDRVIGVRIVKV